MVWFVLPETPKDIITDTSSAAFVVLTTGGVPLCPYTTMGSKKTKKNISEHY
jgi:hypothetical protein